METTKKLTLAEYEQIKDQVTKDLRDYPELRLGQAWFNELVHQKPDFGWIRATSIDPFHRDETLLDLFYHILDEEAYASWTHSDTYCRLHNIVSSKYGATPVDTSGSELSDFVETEYFDPQNNNITQSYTITDDWKEALENSLKEDAERLIREAEEAKRKDEENEKAINEKYRIYNIPADGFYKLELDGSAYDKSAGLYRYLDVYGVVQYTHHHQVTCSANSVVAMMWAEDNDAVWLWKKPFSRVHEPWKLEWSNPNTATLTEGYGVTIGSGLSYSADYCPTCTNYANSAVVTSWPSPVEEVKTVNVNIRFSSKKDLDKTFLLIRDLLSTNPAAELTLQGLEISQW
jgi:hypothetical protein